MSLQDKCALITGSSRGIGRSIALALAVQGCHVAIHYVRKRADAEQTAEEARRLGVKACTLRANLAEVSEAQRLVDEAAAGLGGLDILVNNAASGVLKPMTDLEAKDWDWTVNINTRSALVAAQAAVPHMRRRGWGRIITVSSPGSRYVFPRYGVVGVSKAALESLTRYLAAELAAEGIIVNCVSPGLVVTGALDAFPLRTEMIDWVQRNTPAGRLLTPEDVAGVVAWLCSDQAAMIVGQTIEIDGGYGITMLK
jgi:enoyl-[acyl-carrier protein] reductase III